MALTAALRHVWDLIKVEDWDKTWASICSWWKYVDNNGITVPKVHNKCMHDYTKESVMCQNLLVPGAITIADLWHPVEQRWIHINDIFNNYQERVELRVQLEAERLTREPSMHTHRQAAMVIGKGKGKEKATDKVDELENNEGNCPPNPDLSKTAALAPKANLPCRECTKVDAKCKGLPGESYNPGDLSDGGLFGRLTGLLDNPPTPIISMQDESEGPPVEETPLVTNLSESTMCEALAEHIQLLEGRADDEEFELTQIHQMLGLLATSDYR
ncbi:hypothetical protein F5J12DRAFT_784844 [Pisolithus orientalis]|uniref:uncharacterized protein n=1 Tax=Pisolithus orientalis TaxID=936130 RepID=UPI0022250971|nr:uncharacterized protein F5J12DRAFT_784844 [Pisolithus orientalis]KAI5998500.1 hypothetical protein F5J12DRAFT_784844 [Pisolithus orientalis]